MDSDYNEKMYNAWLELGKNFLTGGLFPGGLAQSGSPLYESWTKDFQSLYDKVMRFPPFSVVGGTSGQDLGAYNEYTDLARAQAEFYKNWAGVLADFSKAWVEGTTAATSKLTVTQFETPGDYGKRAYNVFVGELESKFDALLRDEKFASRLGGLVSSLLDFKQESDKTVERYQSLFNVPTRTEIDRVYRDVHELKRELRRLSRTPGKRAEAKENE